MIGKKNEKRTLNSNGEWEFSYTYFIDGKEVSEAEFCEAFPDKPVGHVGIEATWKTPVESFGMACVPKRIKDFEAFMEKKGVPTDFTTRRGKPVFTSRAHQLAALKALQAHNKDEVRG